MSDNIDPRCNSENDIFLFQNVSAKFRSVKFNTNSSSEVLLLLWKRDRPMEGKTSRIQKSFVASVGKGLKYHSFHTADGTNMTQVTTFKTLNIGVLISP